MNRGKYAAFLQDNGRIAKCRKAYPFLTSTEIRGQIAADYDINMSVQTTRRRRYLLWTHCTKKNIGVRQEIKKNNIQFETGLFQKGSNMVVCSDESQFNVLGSDGEQYERLPSKQLNTKYSKKTIKHVGVSIMVWCCFTVSDVGPLVKIEGIMSAKCTETYLGTICLQNMLIIFHISMIIFQHDSDAKHC